MAGSQVEAHDIEAGRIMAGHTRTEKEGLCLTCEILAGRDPRQSKAKEMCLPGRPLTSYWDAGPDRRRLNADVRIFRYGQFDR